MNLLRNYRESFALRTFCARQGEMAIVGVAALFLAWIGSAPEAVAADQSGAPASQGSDKAAGDQVSPGAAQPPATTSVPADNPNEKHFYIQEYRVIGGGRLLDRDEVEGAVYPYLGPYRTVGDVEQARAALEKAYRDKGYQTVSVQIPPQKVAGNVIFLHVVQNQVGRLRVHGSRYFSIEQIKREAPSLAEGTAPNFTQVTHDLLVLNGLPDRQVSPVVRAGAMPGTVDVDLDVKDKPPLHGSLEINNRYSADTTPLRINGSVSYDNLWQLGHSINFSFQLSPEDLSQVQVFSAYYIARLPGVSGVSFMLEGTSQDSSVNTLGGIGVVGKGQIIGAHAIFTLPALTEYYHSLSLGADYKHFTQDINIAGTLSNTPVTYYPITAAYSGTWIGKDNETDLNASVNLAVREFGSSNAVFDLNRHGASGDFIYFRGDLSHTHELPGGFQVFVKAQGQAANQPLVNSEDFSGGGIGTVRGYLESEELGDNAILGSAEMRSPSLSGIFGKDLDEWRFYAFGEGGILTIDEPLPEQTAKMKLASVGIGSRFKAGGHYNGSLDVGLPLDNAVTTHAYEPLLTFRLWAEF